MRAGGGGEGREGGGGRGGGGWRGEGGVGVGGGGEGGMEGGQRAGGGENRGRMAKAMSYAARKLPFSLAICS